MRLREWERKAREERKEIVQRRFTVRKNKRRENQ
jgi:hypothetical protein